MSLLKKIKNKFKIFKKDTKGATAIEYGLIAALIAVAIIASLKSVASSISSNFSEISTNLDSAITTG